MNEFPRVGRLAQTPIQSTRGLSLQGQPYFFVPPIQPSTKKSAFRKKRAKGGKIIYDNPRARRERYNNLYGGNKLRRNNPNLGRNVVGDGLERVDFGGFATAIDKLLQRREDAELDRQFQLKELEIAKNRALRREENIPQIRDRQEAREQPINKPPEVILLEDKPKEEPQPQAEGGLEPQPQAEGGEEGKKKKKKKKGELIEEEGAGVGLKQAEEFGRGEEEEFVPERERGGEGRYSLRRARADITYEEPALSEGEEEKGIGFKGSSESEFEYESPQSRQRAIPSAPPNFPEVSREDIEEGLSREAEKRLQGLENISKRTRKQRAKEFLKRAGEAVPFVRGDKPIPKSVEEGRFVENPLAREGLVFEGRGVVNPLEEEGAVFGGRVNLRDVDSIYGSDISNEIPFIQAEGET